VGALVTLAASAAADDVPAGTMSSTAASSGSTDVASSGKFEAPSAKPADDEKSKNTTEAQILGGGLLATGNSRSLAATASTSFRMRREQNQFSVLAAANYARAAADSTSPVKPTVENYQGKLRYDRFVASSFALFLASSARRDRFQKLDLRLNVDPGAAFYFVDEPNQQLWGELGYDFQFDDNAQTAVDAGAQKTVNTHSGRAFLGYRNALNEAVAFTTGVEYLQGLADTNKFRVNWDAGLTSKIAGHFSLATTFSMRFDHAPNPGVKDTDLTTAVSLVYQLL
jgi:putative salt-induced outer membrane protein